MADDFLTHMPRTCHVCVHDSYMKEDLAIFNWTLSAAELSHLDRGLFANQTTMKDMCLV